MTPDKSTPKKLWLDAELYIEVDEEGRCIGNCPEGALGFVIQVLSDGKDGASPQRWALKIPRLLSETHRENAYIAEIAEKEVRTVLYVLSRGFKEHLLPIRQIGPGLFRTPIDSTDINDAYMVVQFEKGKKPLLCQAYFGANGILKHPQQSPFPFDDKAKYDADKLRSILSQEGGSRARRLTKAVFLEALPDNTVVFQAPPSGRNEGGFNVYSMENAFKAETTGKTWALGLPSVLFAWADGTLQGAVSRNTKRLWNFEKNITFVQRICEGIKELHEEGVLHADLRPANIVYSKQDPTNPDNYFVADYGGYADTKPVERDQESAGEVSRGPAIIGERYSPFYAPERRVGIERETADTVFFMREPDKPTLFVILGWRQDFTLKDGSVDLTKVKSLLSRGEAVSGDTGLLAGDRIQIRDYIFELSDHEKFVDGAQILQCKFPYWQIFHGKVAVAQYENSNYLLEDYLPIPRTIELRQWSAATDLYSLGALALYGVYYDSRRIKTKSDIQDLSQDTSGVSTSAEVVSSDEEKPYNVNIEGQTPPTEEDKTDIEDQFRLMVEYLSNTTTLLAVWPVLNWIRKRLEKGLQDNTLDAQSYASLRVPSLDNPDENKPLKEETIRAVERFALIVPGSKDLLKALNYNVGYFVLYMHFVMCCLHRKVDLERIEQKTTFAGKEDNISEEKRMVEPYSINRYEQPVIGDKGAAYWAGQRLAQLRRYSNLLNLSALEIDDKRFNEMPEIGTDNPLIGLELQRTKEWLARYEEAFRKIRDEALKVHPEASATSGVKGFLETARNNILASIYIGTILDIIDSEVEKTRKEIERNNDQ